MVQESTWEPTSKASHMASAASPATATRASWRDSSGNLIFSVGSARSFKMAAIGQAWSSMTPGKATNAMIKMENCYTNRNWTSEIHEAEALPIYATL